MLYFFFFKQKTAYEMRISDWSSDVCSSDLACYDSTAEDIDVDRLLQGYLRLLRRHGGKLVTDARVTAIERRGGVWRLSTPHGDFERSEERRVGKECVSTCRSRWSPYH